MPRLTYNILLYIWYHCETCPPPIIVNLNMLRVPFKQSMGNYVEMDLVKGRTLERRQAAVIAVYIMHLRIMNNFGNPVILRL
jgi:hypothetical protein